MTKPRPFADCFRVPALLLGCVLACGPGPVPEPEPEQPEPPEPIVCTSSIEGCECGELGCTCGDDQRCQQGDCNVHSNTCVLVNDDLVYVPAGKFWMGCNAAVDVLGDAYPHVPNVPRTCEDETKDRALPYRQVYLDAYWIDRTEVSKSQYRACIAAGVCSAPMDWDQEYQDDELQASLPTPDDFPAAGLTWSQAKTFCEWAGKRLPTEAEWEKAARGTDGRKYPWGNTPEPDCTLATHIWIGSEGSGSCADKKMTAVGSLPANTSPYGALDMTGNVREWTRDGSDPFEGYENLPDVNPVQLEGHDRIRRGCSFQCYTVAGGGYIMRVSWRSRGSPDASWQYLSDGVRCARDARK